MATVFGEILNPESEETSDPEKCIKQPVPNAATNAKSRSSLPKANRSIVRNALRKDEGSSSSNLRRIPFLFDFSYYLLYCGS